MADMLYGIIMTLTFAFIIHIVLLLISLTAKLKFNKDVFNRVFHKSIKLYICSVIITGFIVTMAYSYFNGTTTYGSLFSKHKFSAAFIVETQDANYDTAYYAIDTTVIGRSILVKRISIPGKIVNISTQIGSDSPKEFSLTSSNGFEWDCEIVKQIDRFN